MQMVDLVTTGAAGEDPSTATPDPPTLDMAGGDAIAGPGGPPDGGPGQVLLPGPLMAVLALVLVLLAILALREVASILVPVLFGLFLALVAWPIVGALKRRGVRHALALTGAMLVVLAVVLVAAGLIALSVGELVVLMPRYQDRLSEQIAILRDLLAQLGISADPGAITSIISPEQIASMIRPVASAVSGAGVGVFILTFTMIYALAGASSLQARATAAYGERHALLAGIEQFGIDLRRYLLVRALLGLFAAVLVLVLLVIIGVPLPLLWAFLVFAASFIPNVGTIIALIPPARPRPAGRRDRGRRRRCDRLHADQLRAGPFPPAHRDGLGAEPQSARGVPRRHHVGVDPGGRRRPPGRAPDRRPRGDHGGVPRVARCGRAAAQPDSSDSRRVDDADAAPRCRRGDSGS